MRTPYLIPHLLERAADKNPGHTALRLRDEQLSYSELHQRARALSILLVGRGAKAGDRIGIVGMKSLDSFVALWGIMDMGGVYVPIDPQSPPERVAYVIRDCGIKHLITQPQLTPMIGELQTLGVDLETVIGAGPDGPYSQVGWAEIGRSGEERPTQGDVTELDLAYIIYTSGSTGVPKGIAHTHRSGLWFAQVAAGNYGLSSSDVMSNYGGIHYDFSTLDAFAGALAAATVLMVPEEAMILPGSFADVVEGSGMTFLYTVPLALVQLAQPGVLEGRDMGALRLIAFGGEVMPIKHLRNLMQALPETEFVNVYGPAETNGCTQYWVDRVPDPNASPVPIGQPFPNVRYLVVDDEGQEVTTGEVGELLVNAPTMMKGYWARPELNQRVFFYADEGAAIPEVYIRTGDLVHVDSQGLLHFHGRGDRMIKSRGFRIELDDVEAALNDHPDVVEAAAFGIESEDTMEVHGAVRSSVPTLSERSVLEHASKRLPRSAMPLSIQIHLEFPRTTSGKIDRRALQRQVRQGVDS